MFYELTANIIHHHHQTVKQVSNCCDSENPQDVEIPTESVVQAYNSSLMVRVTSAIVTYQLVLDEQLLLITEILCY